MNAGITLLPLLVPTPRKKVWGRGSVDAKCVEDKFKETTRAELKRHWGLGTPGGNVLEWPWCLEKGSAGRRGVHGLPSRVMSLLGEERSLDICGGAKGGRNQP